jgi:hypothetical protein
VYVPGGRLDGNVLYIRNIMAREREREKQNKRKRNVIVLLKIDSGTRLTDGARAI